MSPISENPVLNPEAGAKLRFQEIQPEIQQRTIPELPAPLPEPEVSGEEEVANETPSEAGPDNPRRPRNRATTRAPARPGRHRKPESDTPEDNPPPAPPKIRPPDFREWHDFGANFVFKWLCRGYVGMVFRGIDKERVLNAAELKALEPDAEMLSAATKPLAHMASRNKFLTKNGRAIIDSADGVEALIAVGMYANTVRRIARSHESERTIQPVRKKRQNVTVVGARIRTPDQPVSEQPSGSDVEESPLRVVRNGESGFNASGFGVGG